MSQTAIVIGAGIAGLHVAHILNEKGYDVFVLEKDPRLGEQTSGRNSGVIHAGIFYESGSLKETSCIEGNRLTYEWLERLKIPHRRCGKWLVPEEGQEGQVEPFYERLRELPIPTPRHVTPTELQECEPQLRSLSAIEVPSTGIVDAAAYVKALAVYLENAGVQLLLNCEVQGVLGEILQTSRGEISFDLAVNCAGLFGDRIASMAGVRDYEIRPCRGDYYILSQDPLSKPVYHLPYQGADGLGVHLTPTLDGQTLLGPNAFFIEEKLDYEHRSSPEAYRRAVQYYLPELKAPRIQLAYSGNRPKLFYKGEAVSDFKLMARDAWVHLLGIESPGLTAAPALAREVVKKL
jgi:L-2-hydroxyglutarate oxidase LhgO